MRTMIQSEKDLPQFEAITLIKRSGVPNRIDCTKEPENTGDDKAFPLEEARRLAHAILRLDGLTGAEIEAAEHVLSVDRADIRRLREIAGNHAMLTPEFFNLNGSSCHKRQNRGSTIRR